MGEGKPTQLSAAERYYKKREQILSDANIILCSKNAKLPGIETTDDLIDRLSEIKNTLLPLYTKDGSESSKRGLAQQQIAEIRLKEIKDFYNQHPKIGELYKII